MRRPPCPAPLRALILSLLAPLAGCSDGPSGGGDGAVGADLGGGATDLAIPAGGDAAVGYTCARSLHVATDGDDGTSGAASAPLRTSPRATPMAQPGDCVLVHAGPYAESQTIGFARDGTPAAPIVLRSVDGRGAAIIDAAGN